MIEHEKMFYTRIVLTPKIINFPFFAHSGLYFHHHLHFQGFEQYLMLKAPYFKDLVKVFFSNLNITYLGSLYIEVNKKIKVTYSYWLTLANLKY